jgi:ABC-type proline/glycine betaine transport system ATPase subunit
MSIIEIENLTHDYQTGFWRKRSLRALDGLSLRVETGEVFGFLGPNGAGKTTTFKILMRMLRQTSGEARILGRPLDDLRMRARIGYLPGGWVVASRVSYEFPQRALFPSFMTSRSISFLVFTSPAIRNPYSSQMKKIRGVGWPSRRIRSRSVSAPASDIRP